MLSEVNIFVLLVGFFLLVSALMVILASNPVHSVFFLVLVVLCLSSILLSLGIEFLGILLIVVYVGAIAVLFLFVIMMLNLKVDQTNGSLVRYAPLVAIIGLFILFETQYIFYQTFSESHFDFVWGVEKVTSLTPHEVLYEPRMRVDFPLDLVTGLPMRTGLLEGTGYLTLGDCDHPFLPGPFLPNLPFVELTDWCWVWDWSTSPSDYSMEKAGSFRHPALADADVIVSDYYFGVPYFLDEPTNIGAFGALIYDYFSLPFILVGVILLIAMIGPIALTLDHRKSIKRQDIQSQVERDFNRTISFKI